MDRHPIWGVLFTLILSVIIIIGTSYAYYELKVNKTNGESSAVVNSVTLGITYTDGAEIILNDMLPGAVLVKSFSVTNTGDITSYYDVSLDDVTNELNYKDDLVYTITSTNSGGMLSEVSFPSTSGVILGNVSIPANTTQEYTLTIRYINQDFDQSIDMNKIINGKIYITNHS